MPDNNNRLTKKDMEAAHLVAEKAITSFEPPSANPAPSVNANADIPPPPDLSAIKTELANNAAKERTNALFDFLTRYITQTCKDEIDRQQLNAALSDLRTSVNNIQDILSRNNLT